MANNIFQVKRTSTAGRTPNTTGSYATNSQYIAAGEFALNMADQILYTSDGTKLIIVGATQSNATVNNHFVTSSLTVGNVFIGTNSAVNINATTVAVGNSTVNGSISTNSSVAYFTGTSYNALNANNALYLGGTASNLYALTSSLSAYQTTAGLSANVAVLSANSAAYLGTVAAASYVQNTDSRTLSGNLNFTGANSYFSGKTTFNANAVLNPGISLIDSTGAQGTAGQVLTSNGAGNVYWSSVSGGGGGLAATNQIAWTNTQSFSNTITFNGSIVSTNTISANGGVGTAGQVLTSSAGGNVYWSTVSGAATALTSVRQSFTGDGTTTSFSVAGGYTPNSISVFLNGVMLRNGTEVTVTNGASVVFATAPPAGSLIDVIGTVPTTYSSITPQSYSVGFNGSTQYLSVPTNAAFSLTGDFTIEAWVYLTTATGTKCIFTNRSTTGAAGLAWTTASGSQALSIYTATAFSATSSSSIPLNTWTHVALTRSGSTITQWLNGVNVGTVTNSSSFTEALCFIGSNNSGTENWPGYISNFRLVKGVAVYTNNFTVPSSPLTITQSASGAYIQAITGTQTSLLTCNAPTIIDGSTNAFTITNNGSAPVSTAIVPTFTNVTINNAVATATTYSVQALLIAGGGAGGAGEPNPGGDGGGGGGAGGVIQNNINLSVGTVYSIVIGAGGTGGSTTGATGGNSTFAGLTAYGGGGGGDGSGTTPGSGGSGGGAGNEYNVSTWSGGCVYNQGYPGGPSVSSNTLWRGGSGGGGAGGFGTSRTSNVGGNGGSSISLAITGSTVWYAGGGGGGGNGTYGGGTGGNGFGANQGGGGNGGTTVAVPGTGTTNTGGGGGGGVGQNVATSYTYGASGGSGVVILSILTSNYTGTKTGSPTVTTNGSYTILTFTASGSYTA